MTERGIIICQDLIPAVQDGRKMQTRRVIKPQPPSPPQPTGKSVFLRAEVLPNGWNDRDPYAVVRFWYDWNNTGKHEDDVAYGCPYGVVGDLLYVREGCYINCNSFMKNTVSGYYKADCTTFNSIRLTDREWDLYSNRKNHLGSFAGRFMYKSLARTWLETVSIRVERMKGEYYLYADEIVESEMVTARKITDPWVWVIEFKRIVKV